MWLRQTNSNLQNACLTKELTPSSFLFPPESQRLTLPIIPRGKWPGELNSLLLDHPNSHHSVYSTFPFFPLTFFFFYHSYYCLLTFPYYNPILLCLIFFCVIRIGNTCYLGNSVICIKMLCESTNKSNSRKNTWYRSNSHFESMCKFLQENTFIKV